MMKMIILGWGELEDESYGTTILLRYFYFEINMIQGIERRVSLSLAEVGELLGGLNGFLLSISFVTNSPFSLERVLLVN